jgi:hypothetical protein
MKTKSGSFRHFGFTCTLVTPRIPKGGGEGLPPGEAGAVDDRNGDRFHVIWYLHQDWWNYREERNKDPPVDLLARGEVKRPHVSRMGYLLNLTTCPDAQTR